MSDTESDGSSSDAYTGESRSFKPKGACSNCKALKVRCQWIVDEGICTKCKTTGADCVAHGRKKRRPVMSHEQLVQRSQAQDAHIQSLLSQLDGLKQFSEMRHFVNEAQAEAAALRVTPNGLGAPHVVYNDEEPALGERPGSCRALPSDEPSTATARTTASFFIPYYTVIDFETFKCPPILSCGVFGPAEVTALFRLYFDKLYPSFAILDPVLHTPQYVLSKSSLLFTTILYVTSRTWKHRPKLHELARAHIVESIREAVKEGYKTIETCQAFVILSLFPTPHTNSVDSRGWMFMGIAIRIAQDLRLDEQPPVDLPEREKLNRLRTWFEVVSIDSSNSIQKGRPAMIHRNNFTYQMSGVWYRCSPLNSPYDIYCGAYADLMLFVSNLWGPIGAASMNLQDDANVIDTILAYHRSVCDRVEMWQERVAEQQIATHRDPKLELLGHALRLTVLGVGIQHSLKRVLYPNMNLLHLAIEAARHILKYDIEYIYPTGFMRYAIEPQYIYVTYSAAFLINLLRPSLTQLLERSLRVDIFRKIRTLIELFTSSEVVLDKGHMPIVYAAFLQDFLDQMTTGQDIAEDPSAYPSTPTLSNSRVLTHGVVAESRANAGPVMDVQTLRGAEFTVDQFVTEVTTYQSAAYPAQDSPIWHGFPVDEGTW
ncbi:hypothetical protein DAEQUDRAFT_765701 [Daedalea quercina L-15889]|uniref:Zn(2)-C6 fungal-type domain-containing protein n=1 Tax=Daedalea quercina L-15889 TaxID=1314783 RepID=A0A165Q8V1_9APHY|nr:hypothetical protein DAEQUDRAFT_765701 [Daedalea quercina L-15889]